MLFSGHNTVIRILFRDYTPFKVIINYWLYSLCRTMYLCSLLILYTAACASYPLPPLAPLHTGNHWFVSLYLGVCFCFVICSCYVEKNESGLTAIPAQKGLIAQRRTGTQSQQPASGVNGWEGCEAPSRKRQLRENG